MKPGAVVKPLLMALCLDVIFASVCLPEVQITVRKKFARKVAIAVPSFEKGAGGGGELARTLAATLRTNLDASGYFDSLQNQGFVDETAADDKKAGRIDFTEWARLKAEMLTRARYVVRDKTLSASCELYSVSRGQRVFSRNYHGEVSGAGLMVARIANDIIQAVTGEKGLSGSRIAFTCDASGLKQICVMEFPNLSAKQVTSGRNISLFPHWTPDGSSIVFTSYVRGAPEIFLMDLSTRKARTLASFPGLNAFAAVNPDGRDILLVLSRTGNPEIYRMNISSGRLTRLTSTRWVESSPCWSPDGKRIAFVADRTGSPQIYTMDAWGKTKPRRVTFQGSYNADPDWSPLGDIIVYSSRQGGRFENRIVNLETKEETALPRVGSNDEAPSWAPDGRHIVYSVEKGSRTNLYVIDIYEQVPRQLTKGPGNSGSPSWSLGAI